MPSKQQRRQADLRERGADGHFISKQVRRFLQRSVVVEGVDVGKGELRLCRSYQLRVKHQVRQQHEQGDRPPRPQEPTVSTARPHTDETLAAHTPRSLVVVGSDACAIQKAKKRKKKTKMQSRAEETPAPMVAAQKPR